MTTTPQDNDTQWVDELLLKLEDYYNTVYNGILPAEDAMTRQEAKAQIIAKLREARADEAQRAKELWSTTAYDSDFVYAMDMRIIELNSPQGEEDK